MSTRAERVAFVERMRREIERDEPRAAPTTSAARKRVVEVLALEAGLPVPKWDRVPRGRTEVIDTSPWEVAHQASLRAQHQRFGRFGLAFASDGTIRCVKCKEVLVTIPKGRPFAIGAPASALQAMHQALGCN